MVACCGNVVGDGVVDGGKDVADGLACDAVAPGYGDVGGAAVGTPKWRAWEDTEVEGRGAVGETAAGS